MTNPNRLQDQASRIALAVATTIGSLGVGGAIAAPEAFAAAPGIEASAGSTSLATPDGNTAATNDTSADLPLGPSPACYIYPGSTEEVCAQPDPTQAAIDVTYTGFPNDPTAENNELITWEYTNDPTNTKYDQPVSWYGPDSGKLVVPVQPGELNVWAEVTDIALGHAYSGYFGPWDVTGNNCPTGITSPLGGTPVGITNVEINNCPGYYIATNTGNIITVGSAVSYGSMAGKTLNAPIIDVVATPDGKGYWELGADGGVFTFGDAGFYGSTGAMKLNKPVVGMAPTPDGKGYWLVASDGGIFTFGDAGFYGSMGDKVLNKPVVGMAPTPDGKGYWEVASDGGIFTFGDAQFQGSMGDKVLNKPVIGMAVDGATGGYWEVASDGGVFTFNAPFLGSLGAQVLASPVVNMGPSVNDGGYDLLQQNGTVTGFGDQPNLGSLSS